MLFITADCLLLSKRYKPSVHWLHFGWNAMCIFDHFLQLISTLLLLWKPPFFNFFLSRLRDLSSPQSSPTFWRERTHYLTLLAKLSVMSSPWHVPAPFSLWLWSQWTGKLLQRKAKWVQFLPKFKWSSRKTFSECKLERSGTVTHNACLHFQQHLLTCFPKLELVLLQSIRVDVAKFPRNVFPKCTKKQHFSGIISSWIAASPWICCVTAQLITWKETCSQLLLHWTKVSTFRQRLLQG